MQAKLAVVSAIDTSMLSEDSEFYSELLQAVISERQEFLEFLVKEIEISGAKIDVKVLVGRIFIEIIREVLADRYDLVIKAIEKNPSTKHRLFGGTDMKLLRKCPCPVWVIKSTEQKGDREILVALDWQPENPENQLLNKKILEISVSLALADFSELHIVHAWDLPYESYLRGPRTAYSDIQVNNMIEDEKSKRMQWLSDFADEIRIAQGEECANYLKPELHLIQGDAKNIVPALSKSLGVELVVMGTVARTGISGLVIGNTAESILDQLDCSVLALKPEGFVTPIFL
jgi:nucleotide-binding universal stress UspA family protein